MGGMGKQGKTWLVLDADLPSNNSSLRRHVISGDKRKPGLCWTLICGDKCHDLHQTYWSKVNLTSLVKTVPLSHLLINRSFRCQSIHGMLYQHQLHNQYRFMLYIVSIPTFLQTWTISNWIHFGFVYATLTVSLCKPSIQDPRYIYSDQS